MSAINNAAVIGAHNVRMTGWDAPTTEGLQYKLLANYDPANGGARLQELIKYPASFFVWTLTRHTAVGAGASASSARVRAPFPLTVWSAQVGCEAAAGATGTVDILSDDATTDASILAAAADVKTAAGQCQVVTPESGKHEIAYSTELYITGASGSGGSLTGAQAHLICQRL
jgi:hypothetical protein